MTSKGSESDFLSLVLPHSSRSSVSVGFPENRPRHPGTPLLSKEGAESIPGKEGTVAVLGLHKDLVLSMTRVPHMEVPTLLTKLGN